jgi:hypothetical protein
MKNDIYHTAIATQKEIKERVNDSRASGQCYDDFINELVALWERYRIRSSLCGPKRAIK